MAPVLFVSMFPCSPAWISIYLSVPMLASLLRFAHLKGMFWFNPMTPHTNSLTYFPLRPLLWVLDPTIQLELFRVTQVSHAGNVQIWVLILSSARSDWLFRLCSRSTHTQRNQLQLPLFSLHPFLVSYQVRWILPPKCLLNSLTSLHPLISNQSRLWWSIFIDKPHLFFISAPHCWAMLAQGRAGLH